MGLLTYTIARTCAVCGNPIKVKILKYFKRILWGGYYFGRPLEGCEGHPHQDAEYWECEECYRHDE